MLNILAFDSSVNWVARSKKLLPKSPGIPRQKARPRILTRDLRKKIREEMTANQKKVLEFENSHMKFPSSQEMLVK